MLLLLWLLNLFSIQDDFYRIHFDDALRYQSQEEPIFFSRSGARKVQNGEKVNDFVLSVLTILLLLVVIIKHVIVTSEYMRFLDLQ